MSAVIRWRIGVLILTAVVTALILSQLKQLSVIIEMDRILPQSHPYIVTNRAIEETFGNKYVTVIALTNRNGSVYDKDVLRKVQTITTKLREVPAVIENSVISLAARRAKSIVGTEDGMTVRPLMEKVPQNDAEMAQLKRDVASMPVYSGLLVSRDERTTQVVAQIRNVPGGMGHVARAIKDIAAAESDASVEVNTGGAPIYMGLLEKFSNRMGLLFPLALLIIGLIHFEAFRTWQAMFLPLVTAILAVLWALGGLSIAKQPFDVFNSTTPILILAIAAGHAVQILKRYYEEYSALCANKPELDPKATSQKALLRAMTRVGPVMVTAYAIAALSFFSLVIFEIETIRTFGLFTGFGILSALILELTFIPALRSLLPAPSERELHRESQNSIWSKLISWTYGQVVHRRKRIYISTVILVALLSSGILLLKVDNSQRHHFFASSEARVQDAKINEAMAGTYTFYVMIEGLKEDAVKEPKVVKGLDRLQRYIETLPEVGKTVSIADFIKRMNQAMNGDKPEFNSVPESKDLIAQYLFLYSNSGEPGDFDSYVDSPYQRTVVQTFMKTDRSQVINTMIDRVQTFVQSEFGPEVKVSIGGGATLGVAINQVMIREKILNIVQILSVVFLVSCLVFRSFTAGMFILVPLAAVVAVNFGIMGLLGIPLQVATVLISAMAVGIGADYAIYMTYRMREELASGGKEDLALERAYRSAGKATLYVSSAVAGGFGILMFSYGFWIHIWLGFLIGLAMVVASLATLTLFTALIFSVRPKFIFGT